MQRMLSMAGLMITLLSSTAAISSTKERLRYQDHPHVLKRSAGAKRQAVFMVTVVTSPADRPDRRSWQREQWAKSTDLLRHSVAPGSGIPEVILKFAVGGGSASSDVTSDISAEDEEFGDMLLLHDVKDLDTDEEDAQYHWHNTSATTEKVLYSMQWAVEKYHFQYFVRLGDDSYFRPDELYRWSESGKMPPSLAVLGLFLGPYPYETGVGKNSNVYPAGMGYVLTNDVAAWLAASAEMLSVGFPEDAVVGAWLAGTKVQFISDMEAFHDGDVGSGAYRPCSGRDVLVHHMRTQADWERIGSDGLMQC